MCKYIIYLMCIDKPLLLKGKGGESMVIDKDQLTDKKRKRLNVVESFFFITLGSFSLVFLFVICWVLMTGDDVIFFQTVGDFFTICKA